MTLLFSYVQDDTASMPAALPFQAVGPDGRLFTDLEDQHEKGYLTSEVLLWLGYWPATFSSAEFDPETETPTDVVVTLDKKSKTVKAVQGKRALTAEEIEARKPVPPPVADISDRQFAQVLADPEFAIITEDEALAWAARGDLPDALEDALLQVPEADQQRFGARMLLSSATIYERSNPLVEIMGAIMGIDSATLDRIWQKGGTL